MAKHHPAVPLTPFGHVEFEVLLQTFRVFAILSTLGSIFTMVTYVTVKRSWKHASILIFSVGTTILSVCLLFGSIYGASSLFESPRVCFIQGTVLEFIGIFCVLWYSVVAIFIRAQLGDASERWQKIFIVLAFFVVGCGSAVAAALPPILQGNQAYALVGLWCWISDETDLEMTLFYAWMFLSVVIATGVWLGILMRIIRLRRGSSGGEQQHLLASSAVVHNLPRRAPLGPLVRHLVFLGFFAVIFSFMFIHRAFIYFAHRDYYALAFMHVLCLSSCGLIVFITYGATRANARLWKSWWRGQSVHAMQK